MRATRDFISGPIIQHFANVLLTQRPDEVRIATFSLYRKGFGSPLIGLLRLLEKVPKSTILVGYNEHETVVKLAEIAALSPKIEWLFRFGTHVKYFAARRDVDRCAVYSGTIGSHNLSDTGFDELSVVLTPKQAKHVFNLFPKYCIDAQRLDEILPYVKAVKARTLARTRFIESASFTQANDTAPTDTNKEASPEASIPAQPSSSTHKGA